MPTKRVYSFMIDPDSAALLKEIKERDGVAEAEQIRRALKLWFREKGVLKAERPRVAPRKRS